MMHRELNMADIQLITINRLSVILSAITIQTMTRNHLILPVACMAVVNGLDIAYKSIAYNR